MGQPRRSRRDDAARRHVQPGRRARGKDAPLTAVLLVRWPPDYCLERATSQRIARIDYVTHPQTGDGRLQRPPWRAFMTAEELNWPSRASAAAVDCASSGIGPDTGDLTELFRQHHLELVRLAALLVRSREAGEDIVQDVFIKIHARRAGPPTRRVRWLTCAGRWLMAAGRGCAARRWPGGSVRRTGLRWTCMSRPNMRRSQQRIGGGCRRGYLRCRRSGARCWCCGITWGFRRQRLPARLG